MADTIKRKGHVFPDIKRGDTNPFYEIPDQEAGFYPAGSTGLAQMRRPNGDLVCNLSVSFEAGKFGLTRILPGNTRRIPSDKYVIEVQITTPDGDVTTEVHAGEITAVGDNCFDDCEEALIVFSDADPAPALGMRWDFQVLPFTGPGAYVTRSPPNGMRLVLFFDSALFNSEELPLTASSTGFTLTDVPAVGAPGAPQTVGLIYTY